MYLFLQRKNSVFDGAFNDNPVDHNWFDLTNSVDPIDC
jgi:hypothetical protein